MITAGLAKEVEAVNQYTATIQAPTAHATCWRRPVRARATITNSSPAVATTSLSRWVARRAGGGRGEDGFAEHGVGQRGPGNGSGDLAGHDGDGLAEAVAARGAAAKEPAAAVTTGLKCASPAWMNTRISTARPRPVTSELTSSRSPPSAVSRVAAMPDNTYAGIAPASAPAFIAAQLVGGTIGTLLAIAVYPIRPGQVRVEEPAQLAG